MNANDLSDAELKTLIKTNDYYVHEWLIENRPDAMVRLEPYFFWQYKPDTIFFLDEKSASTWGIEWCIKNKPEYVAKNFPNEIIKRDINNINIVADYNPEWLADVYPYWMLENRLDWMLNNRQEWLFDNKVELLITHNLDWLIYNRGEWLRTYRPDLFKTIEVPENLQVILEGKKC